MELKVATPMMVLNYGAYLEEHEYFEESFRAYERGVGLFSFPHSNELWQRYLTQFVARFGGAKLERARDLFEQCLGECPEKMALPFYVMYAQLEEEHGMMRRAMAVYSRGCKAVPEEKRMELVQLYIRKVEEHYGSTKTREVYEMAVELLQEQQAMQITVQFAELERKLGEVDRARALWAHASQFCDPSKQAAFWVKWKAFEVAHGNQDTFREMLRVKRSVVARYSQVNYMAAEMLTDGADDVQSDAEALQLTEQHGFVRGTKRTAAEGGAAETDMEALERQAARLASVTQQQAAQAEQPQQEDVAAADANPDEIDLDMDDDVDVDVSAVERKDIPDAVFGSAKQAAADAKAAAAEPMGALARFQKSKH